MTEPKTRIQTNEEILNDCWGNNFLPKGFEVYKSTIHKAMDKARIIGANDAVLQNKIFEDLSKEIFERGKAAGLEMHKSHVIKEKGIESADDRLAEEISRLRSENKTLKEDKPITSKFLTTMLELEKEISRLRSDLEDYKAAAEAEAQNADEQYVITEALSKENEKMRSALQLYMNSCRCDELTEPCRNCREAKKALKGESL